MNIFNLPDLGEGLAEAEIREWYVKEGDMVAIDQPLVLMETAKAIVEVPSPYAGKVIRLYGSVNDIVQTGSPLISFEVDEASEVFKPKTKNSVVGALEESAFQWDENEMNAERINTSAAKIKAMPAARVLAKEMGVELSMITATGPQNLITVEDVKKYLSSKLLMNEGNVKGEVLHGVRRTMAQVMAESHKEIVAVTIMEDADITHLPQGTDITALLLQAIALAAAIEPSLNALFDGVRLMRKLREEVNIGLAVDTEEGLFVPVIKNVEKKSLEELRDIINHYKISAKNRTILPADMQDASITFTNFGTIAGRYATPIIVPPTVAILGCGRSRQLPVIKNSQIAIGCMLPLTLTFDHRAVTGGEATRFLGAILNHLKQK